MIKLFSLPRGSREPLDTNFLPMLAVLQQCEYDLSWWHEWLDARALRQDWERFKSTQPERWTFKLRFLAAAARALHPFLETRTAIRLGLFLLSPGELGTKHAIIALAHLWLGWHRHHLHIIGIAGSYGKTTTKHVTQHLFSSKLSVLAAPGNINTPLGLAYFLLRSLRPWHQVLLCEFGEYNQQDILELLNFARPDVVILTPIGFAHQARMGIDGFWHTFHPLFASKQASPLIFIAEENRAVFSPLPETGQKRFWYGAHSSSDLSLANEPLLQLVVGKTSSHLLHAALPAFRLLRLWQQGSESLAVHMVLLPPLARRLQRIQNANGTVVIDNSYNTNPSAWKTSLAFLQQQPQPTIVITAGFLELSAEQYEAEHATLAKDLIKNTVGVVLIRTRWNQNLENTLLAKNHPLVVVDSLAQAYARLPQLDWSYQTILIEGGCREMYQ